MKPVLKKKIVIIGASGVGKTSILTRFIKDEFDDVAHSTKMAAYETKLVEAVHHTFKLNIWDTVGQEKYANLTGLYFKDADAVITVFDVTNKDSFERAQLELNKARNNCEKDPVLCLVSNKIDILDHAVDRKEVLEYVRNNKLFYMPTSARTGENVIRLFEDVVKALDEFHHAEA